MGLARCAHGEHPRAGTVAIMAWILWLALPVVAPAVVALAVWLRGRPVRTPGPEQAMQQHQDYLSALVTPARGTIRTEPAEVHD
jgi:hypothetical protein